MKAFVCHPLTKVISYIVLFVSTIFLIGIFILQSQNYHVLYASLKIALFCLILTSGLILLQSIFLQKKFRKTSIISTTIYILAVLSILYFQFVFSMFVPKVDKIYTSPDGKKQIVILNSGFIDACISACPLKYGILYHSNNDKYISRHDCWSAETEIEWGTNSATVYVIFDSGEGRQKQDTIVVPYR